MNPFTRGNALSNRSQFRGGDDRDVRGAVSEVADDFRERPALAKVLGRAPELPNTGVRVLLTSRPEAPGPCGIGGCDTPRNHSTYWPQLQIPQPLVFSPWGCR